jgi:hypothetical protein
MNTPSLALGAVYEAQWSPEPVRIVALDESVVMYDTWWPHKQSWAMSKLLGSFSYYRLSRPYFESHSRYLRTDIYSEQEQTIHRPDLPLDFAKRSQLSWYEPWPDLSAAAGRGPDLKTPSLFLVPFGPRDSAKPAVLVHAANGESFTEVEVLNAARALQIPHLGDVRLTNGVGIYRCGIRKRLPSFYIWGSRSRMDAPAQNAA